MREDEDVHAPVYVKDGSDRRLRDFQNETGIVNYLFALDSKYL